MDRPLLSVIVPSYNQARYIAETLAEPLRLRDSGVETIVIDGGSKDGTKAVLEQFNDQLAYWVSEKDDGQAHAINKGFARATGQWVAFQNSDDFYLPGALEEVLRAIREQSEAEVILGGTVFTDGSGKPLRKTLPKPIFFPAMSQLNFVHNQAFFVRRQLLDRVGGLRTDARFCLDYEWFLRIWRVRPKVYYVQRYVGAQRLYEDTKTSNMQDVHDVEFSRYSRMHVTPKERAIGKLTLPLYRAFRLLFGAAAKLATRAR